MAKRNTDTDVPPNHLCRGTNLRIAVDNIEHGFRPREGFRTMGGWSSNPQTCHDIGGDAIIYCPKKKWMDREPSLKKVCYTKPFLDMHPEVVRIVAGTADKLRPMAVGDEKYELERSNAIDYQTECEYIFEKDVVHLPTEGGKPLCGMNVRVDARGMMQEGYLCGIHKYIGLRWGKYVPSEEAKRHKGEYEERAERYIAEFVMPQVSGLPLKEVNMYLCYPPTMGRGCRFFRKYVPE